MKRSQISLKVLLPLALVIAGMLASPEVFSERLKIDLVPLLEINAGQAVPHEGFPAGVPKSYDWARKPRLGAGNHPDKFSAFTGWGQIFSVEGATENAGYVQIRNFQSLVCYGPERKWVQLQAGDIEGREFRADYQKNVNKPALLFQRRGGVTSVGFDVGTAFHFWPLQGRAQLPDKDICGVVVLLEAIAVGPSEGSSSTPAAGGYLIGLGADYWLDKTSQWDGYKSNRDIAIGRLKKVGNNWSWFGVSTASDDDLRSLYFSGYEMSTGLSQQQNK